MLPDSDTKEETDKSDNNNNSSFQNDANNPNLSEKRKRKLQQQQQEDERSLTKKKILSERPISYGGLEPRRNSTQHQHLYQYQFQKRKPQQQQQEEALSQARGYNTKTGTKSNKKRRFSLTSGHFSHHHQLSRNNSNGSGERDPEAGGHAGPGKCVAVSDIIGSFGLFQMLVLAFSGLREGLVGYDALIMSLILQPETHFLCAADNLPQREYSALYDNSSIQQQRWNETAQCYRSLDSGADSSGPQQQQQQQQQLVPCQSWLFANETARHRASLVAEWSLVCQHHWLIAFIESAYFFGLVTGNLTWGFCADKFGRRPAYLLAHTISLVFGTLAVFMPSPSLFALCRFLTAFGSVGYNIIYSIQVELIGAKHRSFSTILNHMGWGLGVIAIPLVDRLFVEHRPKIALVPLFSMLMYPLAFWLPESSRWLMANGKYEQARRELIRAAKFNGKTITPKLDKKIWALEQKVRLDKLQKMSAAAATAVAAPSKGSYKLIFTSPKLLRDTLILAYLAFVGHLFYYLQTINFAYVKNLSTEANFITSGAGEWVSVVVGAILLKFYSRKTCMSLFLLIMAASFAFQSLIESELVPELDTVPIITTNNGLGTLSSLLLVFIALIVNQEVYPTVVRQTGSSITNTIGELGSTLAPLVIQLSRLFGSWEANVTYTLLCAAGILFAQFLTKTDDIELPDT